MNELQKNAISFFVGVAVTVFVFLVILHPGSSSAADIARAKRLENSFGAVADSATNVARLDAQAQGAVGIATESNREVGQGITTALGQSKEIGAGLSETSGFLANDSGSATEISNGIKGDIQILDILIKRERDSKTTGKPDSSFGKQTDTRR